MTDNKKLAIGRVTRRLAVDVRSRSFGFVVFERMRILDSGVRSCDRNQSTECLLQRFRRLLERYDPSEIITRLDPRSPFVKSIAQAVNDLGIELVQTTPATLRTYFLSHGAITKYEIAGIVAKLLPELAWQLPARRRAWESELYWSSVFDAAALALPRILPSATGRS